MVSTEVWMGSGQSVTLAPESELFLGYMPYGPTLGRTGTNKAHLIKYSLGYGLDGSSIAIENEHGEGSNTKSHFTDYYHLVPDLYTGCTAKFYYTENSATPATFRFSAVVAGNDADAIYFMGSILDFPTLFVDVDDAVSTTLRRGYIVLEANGSVIPAPVSVENRFDALDTYNIGGGMGTDSEFIRHTANSGSSSDMKIDDLVYINTNSTLPQFLGNRLVGKVWSASTQIGPLSATTQANPNQGTVLMGDTTGIEIGMYVIGTRIPDETRVTSVSANTSITISNNAVTAGATDLVFVPMPTTRSDATTSTSVINLISPSLANIDGAPTVNNSIITLNSDNGGGTAVNLAGIFTAGDWVSFSASDIPDTSNVLGKVITISESGTQLTIAQSGSASASDGNSIFWGRLTTNAQSRRSIYTVSPRVLSNNWVGLTNSIGIPQVEQETKQMNLSLAGSRNYTYQYRGMETAGAASIDVNLNHGSWLFYAFGNLSSTSSSKTSEHTHTNHFRTSTFHTTLHQTLQGVDTGTDNDRASNGHSSNGKFHRILKNTYSICPPLLPFTSAYLVDLPSEVNGSLTKGITYTFGERNDNKLPSFALEMLTQKGSALDGASRSLMVDRNTYSENVYAQLYPGCVVSDMQLTANENEEVKATINLNVKRVFEAEGGYVGKCYHATDNDTSEFKNLLNFGGQTGRGTGTDCDITQSFVDPFFFSNGSISLFGQEFLKVSSFTLNVQNSLTDKRYVGQYNKQIKSYVPGQRTYEISMQALVTDRRIFDELRRQSPHRFTLGETDDGSNAKIVLLFTKDNGEQIRLEFDDYLISAATWPIQDDRGPVQVDFTIMPLRVGTLNATTHWVMQS